MGSLPRSEATRRKESVRVGDGDTGCTPISSSSLRTSTRLSWEERAVCLAAIASELFVCVILLTRKDGGDPVFG